MIHARVARLAPVVAIVMTACSTVGLDASDGGRSGDGAAGGTVTVKNASYTGTASSGTLAFVLANDSSGGIDGLTEARVTVGSGELVFPLSCSRCTNADSWCVTSGAASVKMAATNLDLTGSATLTTTCKGAGASFRATGASPAASTTDVPLSLTLKGLYADGSKWTTTAAVQ